MRSRSPRIRGPCLRCGLRHGHGRSSRRGRSQGRRATLCCRILSRGPSCRPSQLPPLALFSALYDTGRVVTWRLCHAALARDRHWVELGQLFAGQVPSPAERAAVGAQPVDAPLLLREAEGVPRGRQDGVRYDRRPQEAARDRGVEPRSDKVSAPPNGEKLVQTSVPSPDRPPWPLAYTHFATLRGR